MGQKTRKRPACCTNCRVHHGIFTAFQVQKPQFAPVRSGTGSILLPPHPPQKKVIRCQGPHNSHRGCVYTKRSLNISHEMETMSTWKNVQCMSRAVLGKFCYCILRIVPSIRAALLTDRLTWFGFAPTVSPTLVRCFYQVL